MCITHSNINLLISALNKAKIINEVDDNSLLPNLCCSISNIACLRRECQNCKVNIINYNEFSNDQNITYFKWIRCQERFMTKTGTKVTNITKKDEITAKPLDIIKILNDNLPSFLKHCYIQQNQYQATKDLKTNLNINCALLNIDFSENFTLKYAQEVQSMHFGGSRKEVCLHTAVFCTFDFHTSSVEPTSVCSCSECLRHDAPAVWAHIVPLLKIPLEKNPFIDTLHFKSDSPTAQYRNKYIFYIITQICKYFSQILYITWNYMEAGHGKGPADAVAGTVKRTAENLVNHGEDINSFAKFINPLSENLERIVITSVTEEDIKAKEQFIPKNLKTFKGTPNVHQVLWDKNIQYLTYRSASCFLCVAGQVCEHGKHIGFTDIATAHLPPVNNECNVTLLGSTKRQNVLSNVTNMPSTSQNDNAISLATDQVLVTKGGNISTIKILSNKKVVFKNK